MTLGKPNPGVIGHPDEARRHIDSEDVAVAMLAAAEAVIAHLWDIAARFETDQCNAIRDPIHRLNTLTLPAIQGLCPKVSERQPVPPPGAVPAALSTPDERLVSIRKSVRELESAAGWVTTARTVSAEPYDPTATSVPYEKAGYVSAVVPAAQDARPESFCQFMQPRSVQPRSCPETHPMDHTQWCGACLMERYAPERLRAEIKKLKALNAASRPSRQEPPHGK